jgi:hypothetical protein
MDNTISVRAKLFRNVCRNRVYRQAAPQRWQLGNSHLFSSNITQIYSNEVLSGAEFGGSSL